MLVPKHGKIGSVGATTDDSVPRACHKRIQGGTRRSSGSPPPAKGEQRVTRSFSG